MDNQNKVKLKRVLGFNANSRRFSDNGSLDFLLRLPPIFAVLLAATFFYQGADL